MSKYIKIIKTFAKQAYGLCVKKRSDRPEAQPLQRNSASAVHFVVA